MNKIRFLSMVVMLLLGITAHGQDQFDPTSPSEPGMPTLYGKILLKAEPEYGGSVSGGGSYVVGESRRIYASTYTGFKFAYWTNKAGEVLSTETSFYFTNTKEDDELTAHFVFDPSAPGEPAIPSNILYYRLTVDAGVGGSVTGGGKYQAGNSIRLNAYPSTGFSFVNWTNENDDVVSTSASFNYTAQAKNETLTANFRFAPSSPDEPTEAIVRHRMNVVCSDGGNSSHGGTTLVLTGSAVTLCAYTNTGYEFVGWYLNGELYTNLTSFSYTMGTEEVDFFAEFKFNPTSPSEPLMPALDKYSYYLMTVNGLPGKTIEYPLYMANSAEAKDMTFRLTFPKALMPRLDEVGLSDIATGYTTSATAQNDSVYVFSMIGGTLEAATTKLLTFYVDIPEDMNTGSSYQVKINQISVTESDGTNVTARTRNGRMGVYKHGDANGDDKISITDAVSIVNCVIGDEPENFISVAADMTEDNAISMTDAVSVVNLVLSEDVITSSVKAINDAELDPQ